MCSGSLTLQLFLPQARIMACVNRVPSGRISIGKLYPDPVGKLEEYNRLLSPFDAAEAAWATPGLLF